MQVFGTLNLVAAENGFTICYTVQLYHLLFSLAWADNEHVKKMVDEN